MEKIGTLRNLRRYPVKSMAGEELNEVFVTFAGLVGDRAYAFVDNQNRTSFPWMTGRQGHQMLLYKPALLAPPGANEEHPAAERLQADVVTPEGEKFQVGDPAFAKRIASRFGRSVTLRFSERAMTDARPVSLFGLATVRALGEEVGRPLDPRRFRANFYVDWENSQAYYEDSLVGKTLRIGEDLTFQVVMKDRRCVMITLDPDTAEPAPEVLRTVAQKHDGCAGVYGAMLREGIVRVNDPVYVD